MKEHELIIRDYDADRDLKALSQIWFDASLEAHHFLGEPRITEQRPLIETVYLPNAKTYVAELSGTQLGFISLLDSFIGGLFVSPKAQGQGIGKALILRAQEEKGDLSVGVYVDNERAYQFYRHMGFTDGERKEHDDEGLPFAVLTMHLKA